MISCHRHKPRTQLLIGIAMVCIFTGPTERLFGYGAGGDIAIFTTPDGLKVDIGFVQLDATDSHPEFFDPNDSVFNIILVPRTPSPLPPIPWTYGSGEPGLTGLPGALPPVKPLWVNTLDLQYWNGIGAPSFATAVGAEAGSRPMPVLTQAIGGVHAHAVFGVKGASTPDGVYLAKLNMSIQTLIDSDPYYMVALIDHRLYTGNSNMDAANADALGELIHAYLADPVNAPEPVFEGTNYKFYADAIRYAEGLVVPEPSAIVLLLTALAGIFSRRSR